jgi:hypothetical protein
MLEGAISAASKLMGQGGPILERPVTVLMESEDKFALNRFVSALAETMRLNGAMSCPPCPLPLDHFGQESGSIPVHFGWDVASLRWR